jgi:hypothetical protein
VSAHRALPALLPQRTALLAVEGQLAPALQLAAGAHLTGTAPQVLRMMMN